MTEKRLSDLLRVTGNIIPEGIEAYIGDLDIHETELLPRAVLQDTMDRNRLPGEKQQALMEALDAVNRVPELVEVAHLMARDAPRALVRCSAIEFFPPCPVCLSGFALDAYAFLYSQLCMLEGRKALRARGIPETFDADIPERMTRKQLKKYAETGDIRFDDYPWDMNFYCCAIFLFDRFYFIPYRWEGSPEAWRNRETGEVIALWKAGTRARRDGQLDGVNGIRDPKAFVTDYGITGAFVRGNRVLPEGRISREQISLDRAHWHRVLGDGDYLLALHIPGGEGYTPERVRHSCQEALAFYDRYFPEYTYLGFWSESWLYDPGLRGILPPERNIIRVQRQFYCYPTPEGEEMIRLEVLGDPKADFSTRAPRNTLERGMADLWRRGGHFHTTGMFLLREEIPRIGENPYDIS